MAQALAKVKFSVHLPRPPAAVLERDEKKKCLEAAGQRRGKTMSMVLSPV